MEATDPTLSSTVPMAHAPTVERVRELLGDAGFGVLTEIDLQATLLAKLGVDVPAQVILGACRPELAYRALESSPWIATLLPCNVVITQVDAQHSRVEVFDIALLVRIAPDAEVMAVAAETRARLLGMMDALSVEAGERHAVGA
ncbi:DUF302 domain-containing protein [Nocardioides sp. WS12]|uniref:DUF302 domain-containing protein n=1 Tax=Nocardioides sp. WS12 TaxID=2486272 RepID=UPI0015FBA607|nr:DUF302 domain-containing protein [Nocardioides sp. WS12]